MSDEQYIKWRQAQADGLVCYKCEQKNVPITDCLIVRTVRGGADQIPGVLCDSCQDANPGILHSLIGSYYGD